MKKIIDAIKQFKEVVELREENLTLYNENKYLEVELEEKEKECKITNGRCQQYYKLFRDIDYTVSANANGSITNLQNKIKTLLKEAKL